MTTRIAINGFGRIGRMVFRKAMNDPEVEVVAINASYPVETLAHLIKYDTIHGNISDKIETKDNIIIVNGKETKVVSDRDPANLPWKELDVEIVIEATGKFRDKEGAGKHIKAGAKKVVITAPGKDDDVTIVMGVNDDAYNYEAHNIISNASCTTNCLAPVAKVLDEAFGIEYGMMTTVHSYTNDQKNLDNPHKDLRRARACAQAIIPTTTGAARAVGRVLPQLQGKLNGFSLRVPTPNVSVVDLVVNVKKSVTVEEVNRVLREASEGRMQGILGFTEEPLVSSDFNGDENSSIVDALSTMVMGEKQVKVLAWYDNEWGYSCRVLDLAKHVSAAANAKKKVEVTV
ncbi:glyceraldehyde-3-phosphate dehydrogenase [Aneurinibacillus aneurinilyticus]|jgi:glyceraldehyde 3-phosphate dehydrogenase|uniref:Glyceraldehyde-3-phosphate dehydrogenase n=1 Tax=Aneurinibacillus aneurinilyticus ATCC 12856 TaxID=649747 RepID=U1YCU5_ANEAE|nr:glyceraldehyde-3-phosphate dehydrogenase [Aneurinibacillus aneurinilyticus]ERI08626.1 glyceraldehyde-3-phosphate dehydrogenase, type I [Aneurinibacillus aneurinilyticus ATCC 12856]MCI1693507.1 glyceraldehyde-3-phosphate dehydrogenase [Aneurinibacillus aneurinilyticus]MED0706149.1 glyceraldehyde-3-phosphate dehydrogenase [Aneurinibacillus aneurinilyticus]MED0725123.1 glyceraldehyde-3-phosphate dehydrogenase [Aneurinibacillus aneurinilyticus]MED0732723.1 glyceraldehyde-3-phosphate dehydrogena